METKKMSIEVIPVPFIVRMFARNGALMAQVDRELEKADLSCEKESEYRQYMYLRSALLRDELQIRKLFKYIGSVQKQGQLIYDLLQKYYRKECAVAERIDNIPDYIDEISIGRLRTDSILESVAIFLFLHIKDEAIDYRTLDEKSKALMQMMYFVEHQEPRQREGRRIFPPLANKASLEVFAENMGLSMQRQAVADILRSENLLLDTFGSVELTKTDEKTIGAGFDNIVFANASGFTPTAFLEADKLNDDKPWTKSDFYASIITEDEEHEKIVEEFINRLLPEFFYLNVIKRMAKEYSRAKETFFQMEAKMLKKKEAKSWKRQYEECLKQKKELESRIETKADGLQRKLNELQLAYDKKKMALVEAEAEIALLKQGLSEIEDAKEQNEPENDEPPKETDKIGDGEGVLLFGGHERFQQKYERLFPKIRTFSPDQDFDSNVIKGARIVCINANYMPHKQFFKIIGEVRKHKKEILYVN